MNMLLTSVFFFVNERVNNIRFGGPDLSISFLIAMFLIARGGGVLCGQRTSYQAQLQIQQELLTEEPT